jgi:ABC-type Mn2+/Zn2+ transport system permease subunit
MANVTAVGEAALQGWRAKVADVAAEPVSKKTPLKEDQVRALVGATFFALSVLYVVKTAQAVLRND